MAANEAGAETFNIKEDSLRPPRSALKMNTPNGTSVTEQAHEIRTRNRLEESGGGGIQTTAGGHAKEMVAPNNTTPPKPTHDYYRNQAFYHDGSLVEAQRQEEGIILPSGRVIHGDAGYVPPENDKDFWNGSVFEKK